MTTASSVACILLVSFLHVHASEVNEPTKSTNGNGLQLFLKDFRDEIEIAYARSGAVKSNARRLTLTLKYTPSPNVITAGVGRPRISLTACQTDTGESLLQPNERSRLDAGSCTTCGQTEGEVVFPLKLSPPTKPAGKIQSITGILHITTFAGVRRIVLPKVNDLSGTNIVIDGLKDVELGIEISTDAFTLKGNAFSMKHILNTHFTDRLGASVPQEMYYDSERDALSERTIKVTLPQDATCTMDLHERLEEQAIPFSIQDVIIASDPTSKPRKAITSIQLNTDK